MNRGLFQFVQGHFAALASVDGHCSVTQVSTIDRLESMTLRPLLVFEELRFGVLQGSGPEGHDSLPMVFHR